MKAGPRRLGTLSFWTILGALAAAIAFALPATSLARMNAAVSSDRQLASASDHSDVGTPSATPTVVGVMGVASRGAARQAPVAPQATVCPSGNPLPGVDVSYYQGSYFGGSVNWFQVAQSGRAFAYARAADGWTFLDPDFQTNYAGIKRAGMKAGAYLYFRPAEDPVAQANTLVSALVQAHFAPGDLVPVFDVEVTDGQSGATVAANLQTAVAKVQQALGVTPVVYTAWGWWNHNVGSSSFGADPLWTANWGVPCPGVPNGWSTWVVWQYNDNSVVPGITVNVDGDESWGPALPVYIPPYHGPPRVFLPVVVKATARHP